MPNDGEVYRKQADSWPPIYAALKDDTGAVIDLTGASAIWEQRSVAGGAWSAPQSVTIDSAVGGTCHVMPITAVIGDFIGHFVVTQSGKVYTVPDDGYIIVHILE